MPRTDRYHHGNLKKTLLAAAVKLIAKQGPRALTLRELARHAKVSHNAPYRHFRDKDDLLAAVAAEGFDRLADSMLQASAPARDPLEALQLCGQGYVQFALRWPEHFSVMFDHADPHYAESGRRAFEVLLNAIVATQKSGQFPAGDPAALALTAWSMVHGVAKLAVSGLLPLKEESAVLDFTAFATNALAGGLQNLTSVPPRSASPSEIFCSPDK